MEISGITNEEICRIMKVIDKSEEVIKQEERYINELRDELIKIEKRTISKEQEKRELNKCSRCGLIFSNLYLFINPFYYCKSCLRRICKNCSYLDSCDMYLCTYCKTLRNIEGISGSWFHENSFTQQPISIKPIIQKLSPRPKIKREDSLDISLGDIVEKQSKICENTKVDHIENNNISPFSLNLNADTVTHFSLNSSSTRNRKSLYVKSNENLVTCSLSDIKEESDKKVESNIEHDQIKSDTQINQVEEDHNILHNISSLNDIPPQIPTVMIKPCSSSELNLKETKKDTIVNEEINQNIEDTITTTHVDTIFKDDIEKMATLHGMIKCEKVNNDLKIKVKIIECKNLKQISSSSSQNDNISSYVSCVVSSHGSRIFKKQTSEINDCSAPVWDEIFEIIHTTNDIKSLIIFLIVKKPKIKLSLKNMMKKKEIESEIYGSVRIGSASFLSKEEIDIFNTLKEYIDKDINDWIEFEIELKCITKREIIKNTHHTTSLISTDSNESIKNHTSLSSNDTTSFMSISSSYYGDENINGKLKIFIKYDIQNNVLAITFINGENLTNNKLITSLTKLFIKCKIIPKQLNNQSQVMTITKNNINSEWNTTFVFNIDPNKLNDTVLIANTYKSEKLMLKKFIGEIMIPVKCIIDQYTNDLSTGFTDTYQLTSKIAHNSYGYKGTISLAIRYEPLSHDNNTGNVEVRIIQAIHLHINNDHNSLLDSYVSCLLLPDNSKKNRKISPVVYKTNDPQYRYNCTFHNISFNDLYHSRILEITIWTKDSHFIGGIRIGINSTLNNYCDWWQDSNDNECIMWKNMLDKPKEWVYGYFPLRYTMISQLLYPSLISNVQLLWSQFISNGCTMSLTIQYIPSKSLNINIHSIEGIHTKDISLSCKCILYANDISPQKLYLQQTNPQSTTFNGSFQLSSSTALSECCIDIRVQISNNDDSSKIKNSSHNVIGHILLSTGTSKNIWDHPTNDEISYFNNIINHPNQTISTKLPLNIFSKAKKIQSKTDKKRLFKHEHTDSVSSNKTQLSIDKPVINTTEQHTSSKKLQSKISKTFGKGFKTAMGAFSKKHKRNNTSGDTVPSQATTNVNLQSTSPVVVDVDDISPIEKNNIDDNVKVDATDSSQVSIVPVVENKEVDEIEKNDNYKESNQVPIIPVVVDTKVSEVDKNDNDKESNQVPIIPVVEDTKVNEISENINEFEFKQSPITPIIADTKPDEIVVFSSTADNSTNINFESDMKLNEISSQPILPANEQQSEDKEADQYMDNTNHEVQCPIVVEKTKEYESVIAPDNNNIDEKVIENKIDQRVTNNEEVVNIPLGVIKYEEVEEKQVEEDKVELVEEIEEKKVEEIRENKVEEIKENKVEEIEEKKAEEIKEKKVEENKVEEIMEKKVEEIEEKKVEEIEEMKTELVAEKQVEIIEEQKVEKIEEKKAEVVAEKQVNIIEEQKVETIEEKKTEVVEEKQAEEINEKKVEIIEEIITTQDTINDKIHTENIVLPTSDILTTSLSQDQIDKLHHKSNIKEESEINNKLDSNISIVSGEKSNEFEENSVKSDIIETTPTIIPVATINNIHNNKEENTDSPAFSKKSSKVSFLKKIPTLKKKNDENASKGEMTPRTSIKRNDDSISISESLYGDSSKISGEIMIGLKYAELRKELTITVKNASNLTKHSNKKDTNDVFVKLHMYPDKSKNSKFETKVIKNTISPNWNENFVYSSNVVDIKLRKLIINIYHKTFTKNIFLGQTIIPMNETINEIIRKGYTENSYPLHDKIKQFDTDYISSSETPQFVFSTMIENRTSNDKSKKIKDSNAILHLKIKEMKNVASINSVDKALCKVYFLWNKSDELKKNTEPTSNINGTFNFNQDITFDINLDKLYECGLQIKLIDAKKSSNQILNISLNNASKKFSWQETDSASSNIWSQIIKSTNSYSDFTLDISA